MTEEKAKDRILKQANFRYLVENCGTCKYYKEDEEGGSCSLLSEKAGSRIITTKKFVCNNFCFVKFYNADFNPAILQ